MHNVRRKDCLLGAVGLVGFGFSLLIHIPSVLGLDLSSPFPYIWSMHVAVLAYAIINGVLYASLTGPGYADINNAEYVLASHGRIPTHLTEAQYHSHKASELRMFSGAWLAFWLVPASWYYFWRGRSIESSVRLLA